MIRIPRHPLLCAISRARVPRQRTWLAALILSALASPSIAGAEEPVEALNSVTPPPKPTEIAPSTTPATVTPSTLAASVTPTVLPPGETLLARARPDTPTPAEASESSHGVLRLAVAGRASASRYSAFSVDDGGAKSPDGWEGRSRIGARMDLRTFDRPDGLTLTARLGVEALTGTFAGQPSLQGDRLPGSEWTEVLPVDAWLGLDYGKKYGVRAGLMTSQWGMGLVANDGMTLFDARNEDWFSLPEVGDRLTRAAIWAAPWRGSRSPISGLLFSAAIDRVLRDDVADASQGEIASQAVLAARMYFSKRRWAGLYYVYRSQNHDDDKHLRVHVIDLTTDLRFGPKTGGLRVQAEAATILGTTNLAPSPEQPEHDLSQFGMAGRLSWGARRGGPRLELDAGWFSGDDDMDDETLTAFKADPNHQQGLILFRRVLAWQTGRARLTAENPKVTGKPVEDLDRLATGGSVTSAFSLFPKVGYGFGKYTQIYTGALIAVATDDLVDPFHTRTKGGGEPRNFLGETAKGRTLGTELAIGMRIRLPIDSLRSNIWLTAEYARLVTGSALTGMEPDSPVHGGRLSLFFAPDMTPLHQKEVRR